MELGEFLHQLEHGEERVVGDGDRLRPGPHPVHVDVGVADTVKGIALGERAERLEGGFGPGHRGLKMVEPSPGQGLGDDRFGLGDPSSAVRRLLRVPLDQGPSKRQLRLDPLDEGRPLIRRRLQLSLPRRVSVRSHQLVSFREGSQSADSTRLGRDVNAGKKPADRPRQRCPEKAPQPGISSPRAGGRRGSASRLSPPARRRT